MKINRRNFEDAPHRSAILEDVKMIKIKNIELSRAGARFLSKQNSGILRMSHTGPRFSKIGARPVRVQTPIARLQRESSSFLRSKIIIERPFLENALSESAFFS